MADSSPKTPERAVQHCFEPNRLQEQLWALAYEHIWPVLRKPLKRSQTPQRGKGRARRSSHFARRAS
jgi:hypothetical protein